MRFLAGVRLALVAFAGTAAGAACLGTSAALAAGAPTAFTGGAGELTTSSATLKGSVYPGDEPTSFYFQYGATVGYGAQTPVTMVAAGTQSLHVTTPITGLAAGSTYHFRLVALNASGPADGRDQTFATKKIPLSFTLLATPTPDVFGAPLAVSGQVSGTGSVGLAVVLQGKAFPYLGAFEDLSTPLLTDASGGFHFAVDGLSESTRLRVATATAPLSSSMVLTEPVALRVTLHVRRAARHGFARLYGTVMPAHVGATVRVQLLSRARGPQTVASTHLRGRGAYVSRFSRVVHVRRSALYRAYVVLQGGPQVSASSRVIDVG